MHIYISLEDAKSMAEQKLRVGWDNRHLYVRAMDEASKKDSLGHLESHLKYGVLSRREMHRKGIDPKLGFEGAVRMETGSDEICVYTMISFPFWAMQMKYRVGVFINAPVVNPKHPNGIDRIIKDTTPVKERKIVGVYANDAWIDAGEVVKVVRRVRPLPVYDSQLSVVWSPQ